MIKAYETLGDLMIDMMPFFCIPFIVLTLRCLLNIISGIARGTRIVEEKRKEKIKIYDEKIVRLEKAEAETKINIDKDLQKYFNYEENKK